MPGKKSQPSKRKGLTPRQAKFVDKYVETGVGTTAAIKAGYARASADVEASRLLGKAKVAEAVGKKAKRVAELAELNAANVLRELQRVAMVDLRQAYDDEGRLLRIDEMPEDVARAIAGVEVDALFEGNGRDRMQVGTTTKVKTYDKVRALELLGKHFALFVEKIELSGKLTFEQLVEESLLPRGVAVLGEVPTNDADIFDADDDDGETIADPPDTDGDEPEAPVETLDVESPVPEDDGGEGF